MSKIWEIEFHVVISTSRSEDTIKSIPCPGSGEIVIRTSIEENIRDDSIDFIFWTGRYDDRELFRDDCVFFEPDFYAPNLHPIFCVLDLRSPAPYLPIPMLIRMLSSPLHKLRSTKPLRSLESRRTEIYFASLKAPTRFSFDHYPAMFMRHLRM